MAKKYKTPQELLDRIHDLREAHRMTRSDLAVYGALGVAYAHGKHWKGMSTTNMGDLVVDEWDENYDLQTRELRVVDNKVGPLLRRLQADLNPTRVEAKVETPRHLWGADANRLASVCEKLLLGIEEDAGFTKAAAHASFMRCIEGSHLLGLELSQKKQSLKGSAIKGPDGEPIEVNDKWLRWTTWPLTDLVWDPSNISGDLSDHSVLMLDQVKTVERFVEMFGPLEKYGLKEEELPTVEDLVPYYSRAAELTGTALHLSYSSYRKTKAVRLSTLLERDPRDPSNWPTCYFVVDASTDQVRGRGTVLNFDNPENPFGHTGRHIFKLDCFPRADSVSGAGAPHVMMTTQDLINMLRSIQFQAISAQVHGQWLVDKQTVDPDEFMNKLNSGVGSVLQWDSRGPENRKAPQMVSMGNVDNNLMLIGSDLANGMQQQIHLSGANLGIGKTHLPQQYALRLLEEAGSVKDSIIQKDSKVYSELLKVTLGTVRSIMDTPNRMLKRLIDKHGFTPSDLKTLSELEPKLIRFNVGAREKSITTRSLQEREQQLQMALQSQTITPQEYWIGMAAEIKQPILNVHDDTISWCDRAVEQIVNGVEWRGVSAIDPVVFKYCVNKAVLGLDYTIPEDQQIIERLNRSVLLQFSVSAEAQRAEQAATQPPQQEMPQGGMEQQGPPPLSAGPSPVSLGAEPQGAPESINPMTNPIGAAGGLPLGLS
tara:strand:+ start:1280 stop:3412 length:2133 start_codon:yes stop_codon:yes gene_type:complete